MSQTEEAYARQGDEYDCMLTLALPADLEEEVLDHLAAHPEWVRGFSMVHAEGFGAGARLHTTMEQVRGRSRRRLVQLLIRQEHVRGLVDSLQGSFRTPEMAWWTSPISGFGRFA
ncbi:MAG TPA: DUF3240 family protein [Steroidobacteraceae bacterium]